MVLFFVYIVFYVDPASGLPNTINVCVCREIAVGDPRDTGTWMGPLVSKEHEAKVRSYLKIAIDEGLKFCCGETVDKLTLSAECQSVRRNRVIFIHSRIVQ